MRAYMLAITSRMSASGRRRMVEVRQQGREAMAETMRIVLPAEG